jgi:hypothetical protein
MLEPINLECFRGDDCEWELTAYNARTKAVYDITGATAFFTLKNFDTDADASAILKVDWTSHSAPTTGNTLLTLTNTQTAALMPRDYNYDVQIKTATGKVHTVAYGMFTVYTDRTIRTS